MSTYRVRKGSPVRVRQRASLHSRKSLQTARNARTRDFDLVRSGAAWCVLFVRGACASGWHA